MKKTIILTALILLMISALVSCKKNPPVEPSDELPPLTEEGKNTFGCKINGMVWIPEAPFSIGGPVPLDATYKEDTGGLTIKATKKSDDGSIYEYIRFFGVEILEEGTFEMSVLNEDITGFNDYTNTRYDCGGYKHDTLNKGTLTITHLDKTNDILSGTFSMKLISSDYCEAISYLDITEGRFDFSY